MIFPSHFIDAFNRSPSPCPLLCMNGFVSQDLANYPVGYTSYIETIKLTSQHTHTHTHTHTRYIKRYNPDGIKVTAVPISYADHLPSPGTAYYRPRFACD
jgi:hypothetical protein